MLPGFQSVYVCVIAFNGHAKPCVDCNKLVPHVVRKCTLLYVNAAAVGPTDG